MTKLEIAQQELNGEELDFFGDNMGNLFDCMDVFAQQEAIAFAEWKDKEGWKVDYQAQETHSTKQLYQTFKTTQNG